MLATTRERIRTWWENHRPKSCLAWVLFLFAFMLVVWIVMGLWDHVVWPILCGIGRAIKTAWEKATKRG